MLKNVFKPLLVSLSLMISGNALASNCPAYQYLGESPRKTDAPDWSNDAQGLANDDEYWYISNEKGIYKYRKHWRAINHARDQGNVKSVGIPPILKERGINHIGDIDYANGYLLVPYDGNNQAIIGIHRSEDLSLAAWYQVPNFTGIGWVAFNPKDRLIYFSKSTISVQSPYLTRYLVDFDRIGQSDDGGDILSFHSQIGVEEKNGTALRKTFKTLQGGVFSPTGDLFIVNGYYNVSPSSARGGIHMLRDTGNGKYRIIHESQQSGSGLRYEYDPADSWYELYGHEPEGIDWWNIATGDYTGQLHALLIENELNDDSAWIKHYEVQYDCLNGIDRDGDGLSDEKEIYIYNSDLFTADGDLDGVEDSNDNCIAHYNPDQLDVDQDAFGDACDPFDGSRFGPIVDVTFPEYSLGQRPLSNDTRVIDSVAAPTAGAGAFPCSFLLGIVLFLWKRFGDVLYAACRARVLLVRGIPGSSG